ncbi:MAG: hypothetical protein IJA15_01790 [Clostridia bacterium]|nr:hypothetical protein [Clostridia bacterium]
MHKTIIKTSIITVIAIVLVCAITYGALALFAPITMGNFYSDVGKDDVALEYYEKAYEKTKTQESFVKLINATIKAEDDDALKKYFKDNKAYNLEEQYVMLIAGKYFIARAKEGTLNYSEVEEYCYGYKNGNPIQHLFFYGIDSENNTFLTDLLSYMNAFKTGDSYNELTAEDKEIFDEDLNYLTEYLNG